MEKEVESAVLQFEKALEEMLEPINQKISKSYSQLGSKGASVRQKQALDARITKDIINQQDPLLKAALEMFPNASEYVEKNPHLLMELLPRLQQLQQVPGFKLADLISPSSPGNPSNPSKHPFGMNEE